MKAASLTIVGGRPLVGTVPLAGAKNAALPMMAAALLADAPLELIGAPSVGDVRTLATALARLGLDVQRREGGVLYFSPRDLSPCTVEADLAGAMRASICLLGPLLARRGRAKIALPGGCELGPRPVDLHLAGLQALGARVSIQRHRVVATADRLRGATVDLLGPWGTTVTGTANVMSAAVLAEGETIIQNAAREPEIGDLGRLLRAMGAQISGLETSTISIVGRPRLVTPTSYQILPDRIEAATYLIAALATGGRVRVEGPQTDHLGAVLELLGQCGAEISSDARSITLAADAKSTVPRARSLMFSARPYPGVPTDVQPLLAALGVALGLRTEIRDQVFPARFAYAAELQKFGAEVSHIEGGAVLRRPGPLLAASATAGDLRGGAALVIAALAARGESVIAGQGHIDRGYERLVAKLQGLGAEISTTGMPGSPLPVPVARPFKPAA